MRVIKHGPVAASWSGKITCSDCMSELEVEFADLQLVENAVYSTCCVCLDRIRINVPGYVRKELGIN